MGDGLGDFPERGVESWLPGVPFTELVEAGDLLRRDGPGLLVVLLRELEAILV